MACTLLRGIALVCCPFSLLLLLRGLHTRLLILIVYCGESVARTSAERRDIRVRGPPVFSDR